MFQDAHICKVDSRACNKRSRGVARGWLEGLSGQKRIEMPMAGGGDAQHARPLGALDPISRAELQTHLLRIFRELRANLRTP